MPNKAIYILLIIVVIILGSLVVINYYQAGDGESPQPVNSDDGEIKSALAKIEVSPASADLGMVLYEEGSRYDFTIKNIGRENLEIQKISTSCGCTKAKLEDEDNIIEPGQSAKLAVTFDPSVHQDDSDLGQLKRVVYINSNDLETAEKQVEINAFVIKKDQKKVFNIEAKKYGFFPNIIKVKEGDYVVLKLKSADVTHGFNLPEFKINETFGSGAEKEVAFIANKKGIFNFACNVFCGIGHGGMQGQLQVE